MCPVCTREQRKVTLVGAAETGGTTCRKPRRRCAITRVRMQRSAAILLNPYDVISIYKV